MHQLLQRNAKSLHALCREHDVVRLELFGSAATGNFDEAASDLDFLAEFGANARRRYSDSYIEFAEALEALFGRSVDLITERSIHDPQFRETIQKTRILLYERQDEKATA